MAIHFNKGHSEFSALAWLCFNVGDCPDRESLNGIIKVEDVGGIIHCIATDTHRMPIVRYKENCPLEIGYYKIVKKSRSDLLLEKVEIEHYPNWQKVIPTENLKKIEKPEEEFTFFATKYNRSLVLDIFFVYFNKCCVDYKFLESVGAFFETNWEVWHKDELAFLNGLAIEKFIYGEKVKREFDYFKFSILFMKIKIPDYNPPKENEEPAEQEQNEKKTNEKEGQG